RYQKSRMPIQADAEDAKIQFEWNIPRYFEAVGSGEASPEFVQEAESMRVLAANVLPSERSKFITARIVASSTINVYDVEINGCS
ncbi:hypothetical protein V5T82_06805, partial [Magnetovibrio sp. PR-2]|uniref:hypothetical protein n=1 Tax=Magnetovibrio sp. PR-2 TaxID=3120356 RepID=UPI002FCE2DE0